MRVACLVSGGKDSHYARWRADREGHEVRSLVNLVPERRDAWLFHAVALEVVPLQAEALGIPLVRATAGGGEDAEMEALRDVLSDLDVEGIVTGGRRSAYQRDRFGRVAEELGLQSLNPLWEVPAGEVLSVMAGEGWEVRIAAVGAEGLGREWLWRRLDAEALEELFALADRHRFHRDGEGGGFETVVLDGPDFAARLDLDVEAVWEGQSGRVVVREARSVR